MSKTWDRITVDQFFTLVPVVIGAGTAMAGIFPYWEKKKNELLTQIIMPVLEDYNELEEAEIAIDILDDYPYEFKKEADPKAFRLYYKGINDEGQDIAYISKEDLPLVLRDYRWSNTSPVEDKVIRSFDALLYFFAELEYIVQLRLLKRKHLTLFKYEIDKVVKEAAIRNFVNIYNLSFDKKFMIISN